MAHATIATLLKHVRLEEAEEGIYSFLPPEERGSDYDKIAKAYDQVVGNALYNKLVWGNWPKGYAVFCRQALADKPDGVFLDAGCGSLVFTASAYVQAPHRQIVLLDRSLAMLRKGRDRVNSLYGGIPENIVFIQGDIFSLPFENGVFDTVASFGVLHIFEAQIRLLGELERVKAQAGHVFFSSLVGNNWLGRKYLAMLKGAGEVAVCHSSQSLTELLAASPFDYQLSTIGNMAYGKSA